MCFMCNYLFSSHVLFAAQPMILGGLDVNVSLTGDVQNISKV